MEASAQRAPLKSKNSNILTSWPCHSVSECVATPPSRVKVLPAPVAGNWHHHILHVRQEKACKHALHRIYQVSTVDRLEFWITDTPAEKRHHRMLVAWQASLSLYNRVQGAGSHAASHTVSWAVLGFIDGQGCRCCCEAYAWNAAVV